MRRQDLSEAERTVLKRAGEIKRDIRRTEAKIRRKERKDRAEALKASAAPNRRQPRERDNEHLKYVRRAPCVACLVLGETQTTPTRAAHIRSGYPEAGWPYTGKAEKPGDSRVGPLCDTHHTDGPNAQHKANERDWWARLGIYPPSMCAALVAARKSGEDPIETIQQITARKHAEDATR